MRWDGQWDVVIWRVKRIREGLNKVIFTGGNIDQGGKHGLWKLSIWSVHESNLKMIETAWNRNRSGLEHGARQWGGGRFGGQIERWELVECDDCGFLYQYSVSVTELQGLQASMFSVLLHLSYTYPCAYTYTHKYVHKHTTHPQTPAEYTLSSCLFIFFPPGVYKPMFLRLWS